MRKQMKRYGLLAVLIATLPVAALADGDDDDDSDGGKLRESIQVADHYMFTDGDPVLVQGATILVRDLKDRVVTATVTSGSLKPYDTYSIWWVVFNQPENCAAPYECGSADLRNPDVKPSVFWGGGIIADGDGYGTTQMELRRGRVDRELFGPEPRSDRGLTNLRGAEIHVVLRTHGPAGIAGPVAAQIGTVNDACPAEGCANRFFSRHRVMP